MSKNNYPLYSDEYFMAFAIEEAKKGIEREEIPVGCVIVINNEIVARSHNMNRSKDCNLYHAEMIAISEACERLGRWSLLDATMYVTLEPCIMCSGAIIQSRIKRLVYGSNADRFDSCEYILDAFNLKSNHKVDIQGGVLKEKIEKMMKKFFIDLRQNKK
ncbi:MAG: nucleoside deaminase [Bacilli bacterium]|nr:nucleoside deaminase [Bacilli bacterium]